MVNIEQQFVHTTPINKEKYFTSLLLKLRIAIKRVLTFLFAKQTGLISKKL